ncbi:hypothetical protein NXT3_PB00158 (plasmid) [Sinorhizobium fredii]|uniref:Uncharacterized protein n=1 Tax=Rhizobium fredii TaxID=380 RepID=A0A2L0HDJ7_RHIFR|nr:hypothetical protein NXT3_PB00158 [Sinorhizobium fredii]
MSSFGAASLAGPPLLYNGFAPATIGLMLRAAFAYDGVAGRPSGVEIFLAVILAASGDAACAISDVSRLSLRDVKSTGEC